MDTTKSASGDGPKKQHEKLVCDVDSFTQNSVSSVFSYSPASRLKFGKLQAQFGYKSSFN